MTDIDEPYRSITMASINKILWAVSEIWSRTHWRTDTRTDTWIEPILWFHSVKKWSGIIKEIRYFHTDHVVDQVLTCAASSREPQIDNLTHVRKLWHDTLALHYQLFSCCAMKIWISEMMNNLVLQNESLIFLLMHKSIIV